MQAILILAVFVVVGVFLVPTMVGKMQAEKDIRMKVLLRAFHSANEAYRTRNPEEGFASAINDLVRNKKKISHLSSLWLSPKLEGFSIVYQSPESIPRNSFSLSAQKTGVFKSFFCIDQRGILRSGLNVGKVSPLTADDKGCHGGIEVV